MYTNLQIFEPTRGATMVGAEGPENFDSSRLAKSALLFFNFTLKQVLMNFYRELLK